ncbi:DUF2254 family protein [Treponema phagedenis]|uniref:DUF2254 family protein n=1 Tax=Treponema phagedenis TaxID=162 RepID=UPI000466318D|nr:DUF2254 family protein [Treponema phagedenis]NVP24078.1 DUF2254 domain-containing protein [Treponema phagedenis]QEJ96222.1 DUF2254 domain-containing protein [Treponema phagedenis]QEJ99999.1 DUF2254 domain-containing protein [Treponema phagedenis]QEK07457.1 DUF2254 domain-containing protein [Treponema phagedenis]QKS93375.1 DUF2254 domain-containing protein [Treponema phagedenis]
MFQLQKNRLWLQNNKIWIYILKYITYSFILLLIVGTIDLKYPQVHNKIPEILLMNVGLSTTLLTTLAGAFLTITTFTFSTMMTVINMYSSSFTPSMLSNFTNKRIVAKVLGVFVGGFLYCLLGLFIIGGIYETRMVLAGGIATVYAIFCMLHFLLFVHEIFKMVRGSNIVQSVYEEALPVIRDQVEKRKNSAYFLQFEYSRSIKIYAIATGYLSIIDTKRILNILSRYDGALVVEQNLGDYVVKGFHIATLHLKQNWEIAPEDEKEFLDKVADCFIYQEEKYAEEDYRYSISKLVETAMCSIGPGSGDPNRGVHCIRKICVLLGKLFSVGNSTIILAEDADFRIVYKGYTVEEELYYTFRQILKWGKSTAVVIDAILEGLYVMYRMSEGEACTEISKYAKYVYKLSTKTIEDPYDKAYIKKTYRVFIDGDEEEINRDILEDE